MRIACLYDIHANLPALEAVLADLGDVDLVVVGGDVVPGPMPEQSFALLEGLDVPVRWVRGNGDRETLDAAQLGRFEATVSEDGVLFCHGTPRSDEEVVSYLTPDEVFEELLADVVEATVVGGHTHQQFERVLGERRWLNAGSVGLPYEGRAGAFWLLLEDGAPLFRSTAYDVGAAAERIRATGDAYTVELLADSLLEPVTREEVAEWFERAAGRARDQ